MIQQLLDLFSNRTVSSAIENFTQYEIKFTADANFDKLNLLKEDIYNTINFSLSEFGYEWSLVVEEINFHISQNQFVLAEIEDFDEDLISVSLNIHKKNALIKVFNETLFFEFIKSLELYDLLKIISDKFSAGFKVINKDSLLNFSSRLLGYNYIIGDNIDSNKISSQCLFKNLSEFKFTPEDFHSKIELDGEDLFISLLKKVELIFILVFISDSTEIKGNHIFLKISGFKTLDYNLEFETLSIKSLDVYRNIYDWIYSEPNKVEDKIGIAKNILSIYLKDASIDIDDNTFNSILSANKTYIKGSITKYIDVRNKIHDQIEQISTKVNSSLENFSSTFQKTIFLFISFYLSMYVLKIYTKNDIDTIINKETTIMALGLLGISAVFLIFSIYILHLEKSRINDKYETIKKRSLDLLVAEDISKILNDDFEFKKEVSFFNKRRNTYIILWIITLVIFLVILFTTSAYINFKYI